ncbi:HNH endonuclease [Sphingobium sp. WW5]|uniref:HNH endonuclease n=1 Tax=unclassified Sphingobium TaxID=2611147 RepID=UPI00065C92C2
MRFCSTACLHEHRRSLRITKACLNCGEPFTVSRSHSGKTICSRACATAYYVRDRSHGWRGGVVKQNGRKFRRIDRQGFAGKYNGEHRLVAEREIGRRLERNEVVICLDGDNDNHAPANLFLLPDQKEFGLLKMGSVPWPAESNLRSYRDRGYIRPDVIVVLHEWENERRQNPKTKRYIKRHPHADEIIKRRRAGASVRQLAKDFGTSMSTMAQTIRNRL